MITEPEPVQQHDFAVLLQGRGISEVFVLVEAGLQYMKGQCLAPNQWGRLRGYRDALARAHDDRMRTDAHDLPAYVVAEAHSKRYDVADLMSIADAAEKLERSEQHVRRLARTGVLRREPKSGLLIGSDVMAAKRIRQRRG